MDISLILTTKFYGAQWVLDGDTYEGLEWLDEAPKPTEAELETLWPEVEYETAVEAVKAARHAAYIAPDGSDALFMKYQRAEDGVTKQAWLDRIAEINAAHPYPEKPEA